MRAAAYMAALVLASVACGTKPTKEVNAPTPQSMSTSDTKNETSSFTAHLPANFERPTDAVGSRLLNEYGAVFVARGVTVPNVVVFNDSAAVTAFQSSAASTTEMIGDVMIELQEPAMRALKDAINEATSSGLSITPRGNDAAKRSYEDTVELWNSRVAPGLDHWTSTGRITVEDGNRIRALTPFEQVPEILKLEEQGVFFSKDFSKSIIYSVAPPGASQHLSMLALDVTEFENAAVRRILSRHRWFQTVVSDLPHFTYLGVDENELPNLGLRSVVNAGRVFWVPDL